jgi:hypothetical protein
LAVNRQSSVTLSYWLSWLDVAVVGSEKLVDKAGEQFGNPEEGERPPLQATTKQRRLVKTEKALSML